MKSPLQSRHPLLLWTTLLILMTFTWIQGGRSYQIGNYNQLIDSPGEISDKDIEHSPEIAFAKAAYLNDHGDYQQALRLLNELKQNRNALIKERADFNSGAIYLQQAVALWRAKGVWELNKINTLMDLAQQSLEKVLLNNPDHKQARYNLEYLLRVRPPGKEQEESDWSGHKSSVHAVMPGIPAGGP